jgi:hypothetical protein
MHDALSPPGKDVLKHADGMLALLPMGAERQ